MNGRVRLQKLFPQFIENAVVNQGIPATNGRRNSDGSYTVDIKTRPGWFYVTYNEGGRNTVGEALAIGIPPLPQMPVKLLRMADGQFKVEADGAKTVEWLGDIATHVGTTGRHTHEDGGGNFDYVSPNRFTPGLVHATTPASMSVQIEPFSYDYGGSEVRVPLSTFDLTPYQPGTAAMWQWVKVGYDPAAQAFVAVEGDELSVITPLIEDDLADISMTGYIPLGAVRVRADDASIPAVDNSRTARFVDDRHFLSGSDVLGDGRYVQLSLFDANTILKANADDTPIALTVAEGRLIGRPSGGVIDALTPSQVIALLTIVVFNDEVVCHNNEIVTL